MGATPTLDSLDVAPTAAIIESIDADAKTALVTCMSRDGSIRIFRGVDTIEALELGASMVRFFNRHHCHDHLLHRTRDPGDVTSSATGCSSQFAHQCTVALRWLACRVAPDALQELTVGDVLDLRTIADRDDVAATPQSDFAFMMTARRRSMAIVPHAKAR